MYTLRDIPVLRKKLEQEWRVLYQHTHIQTTGIIGIPDPPDGPNNLEIKGPIFFPSWEFFALHLVISGIFRDY